MKIEDVVMFQIEQTLKMSKMYSQKEFDRVGLDITIEQWIILKIIDENENISQREIANKSLRDPASITRTLDLLQKKDLIVRVPLPDNRRQYHIKLSSKGREFISANMKIINQHRAKSVEGLSKEEIETLATILNKIRKNME